MLSVGIYYQNRFFGAICFGHGSNKNLFKQFAHCHTNVFELTRIAIAPNHIFAVSQCIKVALGILKSSKPDAELVISYADTAAGHSGSIYQASNWIYLGPAESRVFKVRGRTVHRKSISQLAEKQRHRSPKPLTDLEWVRRHLDSGATIVAAPIKHKYARGLSRATNLRLLTHASAYPKSLT